MPNTAIRTIPCSAERSKPKQPAHRQSGAQAVFLLWKLTYPGNARVALQIVRTAYAAVSSSVIGMASHSRFLPASGRSMIKIPLTTSPRATDTTKAAFGFMIA